MVVVGVGILAWRSAELIALVLLAVIVAVPLRRAVSRLERARVPRGLAAGVVIVATLVGEVALTFVVVRPLTFQVGQLVAAIPALVDAVRHSGRLGEAARALGGLGLLGGLLERLPALAESALGGAASAASRVAGGFVDTLTVLVTAMLFVAARASPFELGLDLVRPEDRARWDALGASVEGVLSGYVTGLGAIVAVRFVATTAFFAWIRVPFFLALATFAAATILLPYLGSIIRFAVLVPLAAVWGGRGVALATVLFLAAYDVLENYVLSPVIFRRAVALSPVVQFLAVLFLGYHAGAIGAIVALPLAAAVQAVVGAVRARGGGP
jgi:predicted PurR-regulated permease PerM